MLTSTNDLDDTLLGVESRSFIYSFIRLCEEKSVNIDLL